MNRLLTVVLCSLLAACGGSSGPSGPTPVPTPPAGTSTLTFVSTLGGAPVAGARITVAGVAYTTNASGQISLSTPATAGVTIDTTASGFIDRATVVRSDSSTITLWQVPAGVDATFLRQLVYNHGTTSEVLWRPTATAVYIQLTGDLTGDSASRSAHVQAAAMATAMTGGRVQVQVSDAPPSGQTVFTITLNSAAASAGLTSLALSSGRITGGRIEYRRINEARIASFVAHEVGHALGFGHPTTGLMCPASIDCASDFGQPERDVYTSMWQRNPGTLAPDNDRATSAASMGETTHTFVCGEKSAGR
jgi:hypothetical protein